MGSPFIRWDGSAGLADTNYDARGHGVRGFHEREQCLGWGAILALAFMALYNNV